jgi:hypothetical protein
VGGAARVVAEIFPTLLARLTRHVFTINMLAEVVLDAAQTNRERYATALYLAVIRFIINIRHARSWVFDENIKIYFHLDWRGDNNFVFSLRNSITSCQWNS